MNRIYQETDYPRLVWQDGTAFLDESEMDRLARVFGEEYLGPEPSEPIVAEPNEPRGALAAFQLAFPNHSFNGVGPDYPPPFAPTNIEEEVIH